MYQSHYVPRVHSRYPAETPIKFATQHTENLLPAHLRNISEGGMYLESRHPVNPHSDVFIWLEKKLPKSLKEIQVYDFYRSKVLWCKEINKGKALGIGVQHVNKTRWAMGPEFRCSICEDQIPFGKVHFVKDYICLCSRCYHEMESCSKNSQDEIIRFLEGNVF
jgi:hypothetical protein